jgi:protein-tyrosine-phosphatase
MPKISEEKSICVIFLCTGNAARSVMGGVITRAHDVDVEVVTAGTHVIEGMPVSWRTRDALATIGLSPDGHRSYQLRPEDAQRADLVVAMAGEHVNYMRRVHPEAAERTVTLKRLERDLAADPSDLRERISALGLMDVVLEPWEDVVDPAGGDLEVFSACAREINDLLMEVLPRL